MLQFQSVNVPSQVQSCWTQIYSTVQRILTKNPSILKYWIHVRRDSLYRKLSHYKIRTVEDIWTNLLSNDNDTSINDVNQIYEYIRTKVNIIVTDIYCTSFYYAQTRENQDEQKSITITLSGRLFLSDHLSFIFVASAVLLRELTRAIYPEGLRIETNKKYIRESLFLSWTGIPLYLWPIHLRKLCVQRTQHQRWFWPGIRRYAPYPCDGLHSLVSDVGNLFQHIFYNGEVHLYDEFDERTEQIITDAVIKTNELESVSCAARYLNEEFFADFFHVDGYCLEMVREIPDQTCPYPNYPYIRQTNVYSMYFFLIVTDTSIPKQWCSRSKKYLSPGDSYYAYKPYRFYEPRQSYEQVYFSGHPPPEITNKCGRFFEQVISSDDEFFVKNRALFRRTWPRTPDPTRHEIFIPRRPHYDNTDLENELEEEPEKQLICVFAWYWCLNRIQKLYTSNKKVSNSPTNSI